MRGGAQHACRPSSRVRDYPFGAFLLRALFVFGTGRRGGLRGKKTSARVSFAAATVYEAPFLAEGSEVGRMTTRLDGQCIGARTLQPQQDARILIAYNARSSNAWDISCFFVVCIPPAPFHSFICPALLSGCHGALRPAEPSIRARIER